METSDHPIVNKSLLIGFATGIALVFIALLIPQLTSGTSGLTASAVTAVTPPTTVAGQIACVRKAVDARENAINKANTTYEVAANTAYATRATALDRAYTNTTWASVTAAVNTTFSTFNLTIAKAASALKTTEQTATTNYNAAVALCGGSSSTAK